MGKTALDVIRIAENEIGVTENPANSNRQKYGAEYGWNGVPWCVQFLWWCFKHAGCSELFYGGNKAAYCPYYVDWAKKQGQWVTSDYRAGDIGFFDFDGDGIADHTGIIESASVGGVTTIEGNTSLSGSQSNGGAVLRRWRPLTQILGAARPAYDVGIGDVSDWAKDSCEWAVSRGIIQGDGKGNFGWNEPVSLERLATILHRYDAIKGG